MPKWVPINQNHAIAVMAVYVRFSTVVPELLLKRCMKAAQPVAEKLGLNNLGHARRVQMKFSNEDGFQERIDQVGQVYTRRGDLSEDGVAFKSLESLQVDPDALTYRTTEYISWNHQSERISDLFSPVIALLQENVVFQSIGMEYLDRWKSVGDKPFESMTELIREDTDLVARHVFDAPGQFHCHTGAFINDDPENLKLQSVNVDAVVDDHGHWINVTTLQERRYPPSGEQNANPFEVFAEAHADLKALLGRIITDQQAERIYLNA